jgi:beta-galactosidase
VEISSRPYAADGQDIAMFTVTIVDSAGNVVPNANPLLTYTVSGPGTIYALGNGDPADHTPDKVCGKKGK